MPGFLEKYLDEKSSFGNGWRFFMLKKVMADKLWREYVRRGLTGRWREERVLRGLGERGSPQRCNPVNTGAFTGLAAFAASPGGSRCLPVSKLPASVGFLPVALLIVMQQFDCSC